MTLALFRILDDCEGCILIDGIDIKKISIRDLRKSLTIIAQDPVLFSGSIRMNLDPFEKHTDYELWQVLKKVNLKEFVMNFKEGLSFEISQSGSNLR